MLEHRVKALLASTVCIAGALSIILLLVWMELQLAERDQS